MLLSFVIVNYKSEAFLEKCIASIVNKINNLEYEIIVVNNDWKKLKKNKIATILEINKNIGFGKAINRGVALAKGKYVCFINPDAEIVSENVADLIQEFEADTKIGIIGPKIIEKNNSVDQEFIPQPWSAGVEMRVRELFLGKIGLAKSKKIWESQNKIKADWVSGAAMFFEKKLFLEIGGFDENFFLYYEDVDICRRVKNLNREVIYFPKFQIKHLGGKSCSEKKYQKKAYYTSQDYYYKKWFKRGSVFLIKLFRIPYLLKYRIIKL